MLVVFSCSVCCSRLYNLRLTVVLIMCLLHIDDAGGAPSFADVERRDGHFAPSSSVGGSLGSSNVVGQSGSVSERATGSSTVGTSNAAAAATSRDAATSVGASTAKRTIDFVVELSDDPADGAIVCEKKRRNDDDKGTKKKATTSDKSEAKVTGAAKRKRGRPNKIAAAADVSAVGTSATTNNRVESASAASPVARQLYIDENANHGRVGGENDSGHVSEHDGDK